MAGPRPASCARRERQLPRALHDELDVRSPAPECRPRSIVSGTMGVRIGTGLSTVPDPRIAALEAASAAAVELNGSRCELAVVFVSGNLLSAPEAVLAAV